MKNFSALKVYLRALSLIMSLLLVLTVIGYLQSPTFHHYVDSKSQDWGLTAGPPTSSMGKGQPLRLCRTRIQSLEWSNHSRIFEDSSHSKARWLSQVPGAAPRELDSLEVEKWFGINCVVKVFKIPPFDLGPDFLIVQFVDGTGAHLKKTAVASDFAIGSEYFRSPELASSLSELYKLGGIDLAEPR